MLNVFKSGMHTGKERSYASFVEMLTVMRGLNKKMWEEMHDAETG